MIRRAWPALVLAVAAGEGAPHPPAPTAVAVVAGPAFFAGAC